MSYSTYIIGCPNDKMGKIIRELNEDEDSGADEIEEMTLNEQSDFCLHSKVFPKGWSYRAIYGHVTTVEVILPTLQKHCGDEFIFSMATFN